MRRRLRFPLVILFSGLVLPTLAQTVRDPMRPAGAAPMVKHAAASPTLKLEGVISGPRMVAIVNGRLVREGDSVAGARVVAIFASGVRLERAGHQLTLNLATPSANVNVRVARSRPEEVRP